MLKLRSKSKSSSSSAEVDFLSLCKSSVHSIEVLASGGKLLNRRQCQDLSSKLSTATLNICQLVLYCGAPAILFRPALEDLYRCLEKAKVLVGSCGQRNWCAAAVFQCQNENAIYELAKSKRSNWNDPPQDLRESFLFLPARDGDVHADQQELRERLDDLANGYTGVKRLGYFRAGRVAQKQSLAKYLLVKMYCTSLEPHANTLDAYSAILWAKVSEPLGTWGSSCFLGAGSGASGVCSTEWLGIPCAKKEFHGQASESLFLKEAGILAHLKHPCIVNFICCGNGLERGDRFIAMELMEKSLFDLIEEQRGVSFSLPVVIDVMVQIACGVCYLHSQGVAHRDLKPQNVVVNRVTSPYLVDDFCVKLVDFGMSKTKVEVSKANTISYRGVGTIMYRAPEVHPMANPDGEGKVNWFKADAFSFAMTCAHLLSLKIPFKELNSSELYTELTKNAQRPELPSMCPQDLVVLLGDCWKTNPQSRPSFVEIGTRLETLKHKFLRGYFILDQGLEKNKTNFDAGFDFIKSKLKEKPSIQNLLDDDAQVIDLLLSIYTYS
jgi:serine/threonine protein kinase